MPTIHVGREILDKHFISSALGEPVTEFRIRKGNNQIDDSVASNLVSLDARLASGEILNLIYKCMNPLSALTSSSKEDEDSLPIEVKLRQALEGYSTEIQFYQYIAPRLESLSTKSPLPPLPFVKLYSAENHSHAAYLLLQDLRPLGFKVADKFKGLSVLEVSLVMNALGRFHAQSYALLRTTEPMELFHDFKSQVFIKKHPLTTRSGVRMGEIVGNRMYIATKEILSRKKNRPDLAAKMSKFDGKMAQIILRPWVLANDEDPSDVYFRVLNHGDLWIENIIFKYNGDNGTPEELRFIDFQQTRRSCIYEDLLYFFFCATTPQFRKEHLKNSLDIYYDSFAATLESFDLSCALPRGFTRDSLLENYNMNLPYGFCYFIFALGFQLGVFHPPPSPSPELDSEPKKQFEIPSKDSKILAEQLEDYMTSISDHVLSAVEASPKGLDRLEKVVEEMIELGVL